MNPKILLRLQAARERERAAVLTKACAKLQAACRVPGAARFVIVRTFPRKRGASFLYENMSTGDRGVLGGADFSDLAVEMGATLLSELQRLRGEGRVDAG